MPRFTNWAQTFTCEPAETFYPSNEEEVQAAIRKARKDGRTIRGRGAGHSPSDLVCVQSQDYLLDTRKLDRAIEFNEEECTATVQAGIILRDLHPILAQHGMAISSLGSISEQALGGAISTATHGTSLVFGNLSTFVKQLTVVLADEECSIITCDRENHPEIFEASRCGLGCTGIITRIKLQCEKTFNLHKETFSMKALDFIDSIDRTDGKGIQHSAQHLQGWWYVQTDEVLVSRLNRTPLQPTLPPTSTWIGRLKEFIKSKLIMHYYHQFALFVSKIYPRILPPHCHFIYNHTVKPGNILEAGRITSSATAVPNTADDPSYPRCSPTVTSVGPSVSQFNYDCSFPQYTYEGVVPLERTAECLRAIRSWILLEELRRPDAGRLHFPIEIRFSKADDVMMSPTFEMDGCYIGIVHYKPYGLPVTYRRVFDAFESLLFAYGGKPHWAKSYSSDSTQLRKMFPNFDKFMAIRERCDPQKLLCNPYIRRHFFDETRKEYNKDNFRKKYVLGWSKGEEASDEQLEGHANGVDLKAKKHV